MSSFTILEEYRGWLQGAGRARGTIALRLSHARRLLEHTGVPVNEVTTAQIIDWFSSQNWGPCARASARASVKVFFDWAIGAGYCDHNPGCDLPRVNVPRAVPRPVPDAYILDTMRAVDQRVALAVELMATCGLRRAECARIKAGDAIPRGQGWVLHVTGKGGHQRLVPCPPHLARKIAGAGGYLFPGSDHGHISPGWLGKLISRALPGELTAHQLRHRYGITVYQNTHDLRACQELLGHASPATTQIYTAASDSQIINAARMAWRVVA